MNNEAESSAAGARHTQATSRDVDEDLQSPYPATGEGNEEEVEDDIDPEEDALKREQRAKERRLDAKRKRLIFLEHLLRELDMVVFLEFITLYHLEYVLKQSLPLYEYSPI